MLHVKAHTGPFKPPYACNFAVILAKSPAHLTVYPTDEKNGHRLAKINQFILQVEDMPPSELGELIAEIDHDKDTDRLVFQVKNLTSTLTLLRNFRELLAA